MPFTLADVTEVRDITYRTFKYTMDFVGPYNVAADGPENFVVDLPYQAGNVPDRLDDVTPDEISVTMTEQVYTTDGADPQFRARAFELVDTPVVGQSTYQLQVSMQAGNLGAVGDTNTHEVLCRWYKQAEGGIATQPGPV